MEPHTIK